MTRIERATPRTQTECSTKLSYIPQYFSIQFPINKKPLVLGQRSVFERVRPLDGEFLIIQVYERVHVNHSSIDFLVVVPVVGFEPTAKGV